jgi:hypothetical protein
MTDRTRRQDGGDLDTGGTARRDFLKGVGLAAAGTVVAAGAAAADPRPLTEREKLDRIASNTYPMRWLFKRRARSRGPPRRRRRR